MEDFTRDQHQIETAVIFMLFITLLGAAESMGLECFLEVKVLDLQFQLLQNQNNLVHSYCRDNIHEAIR